MKSVILFLALAMTAAAAAPIVVLDRQTHSVAVAREGQLSVHDAASGVLRFTVPIEIEPTFGTAGDGQLLLVDAIKNRGFMLNLRTRRSRDFDTGETPVDAAAFHGGFLVLARDSSTLTLERFDLPPLRADVPPQSTLLETSDDTAFVYSPSSGDFLSASSLLKVISRGKALSGASDLELSKKYLYLVFPGKGRIDAHDRATLRKLEHFSGGAVPVDLITSGDPNALGAGTLTIADPSSKRIWREEGTQSELEAFSRGLLRGMLGLGLYSPKSSEIPTGVDRLHLSGKVVWAYDSTTRTLYRSLSGKIAKIATNLDHRAIAPDGTGGVWIAADGERLRRLK